MALFAALAFAAPAQAQLAPPPTVIDFEALQPAESSGYVADGSVYPGLTISGGCGGSSSSVIAAPAAVPCTYVDEGAAGQSLGAYGTGLELAFAAPQATVSFRINGNGFGGEGGYADARAWSGENLVGETRIDYTGTFGRPVVFNAPSITSVQIVCNDGEFSCSSFEIDDLSYSTVAQPDTEILPLADGRLALNGNQPVASLECSVDGAEWSACRSPVTLPQLGAGTHTLTRADDRRLRLRGQDARGVHVGRGRPAVAAARAGRSGRGRRRRARHERQLHGGAERRPGRRRP